MARQARVFLLTFDTWTHGQGHPVYELISQFVPERYLRSNHYAPLHLTTAHPFRSHPDILLSAAPLGLDPFKHYFTGQPR